MHAISLALYSSNRRAMSEALKWPKTLISELATRLIRVYFLMNKRMYQMPLPHATNKKWMQQYRQCLSYFNKLRKEDLLQFVADACFSDEALER